MKWYFNSNLLVRILIGLILGAVAGIAFGPAIAWVSPLGDLFVRLLKMIVMPVVIFTLIVGTASISPSRLGKVGVKILIFYMVTSAFAVGIGLLFGNLLHPGEGLNLMGAADVAGRELKQPSLVQTFLEIVPKNPFAAITSGKILPTIFASVLFGIGLSTIRENKDENIRKAAETVYAFFTGCSEIMYKVVHWVLQFAPIGVFALIAVVFGKQGAKAFGPLLSVTGAVYLALAVHIVVVYGGILAFNKLSLKKFLSKAKTPALTAFVTRSSGGTLPVTMETAEHKMGVSRGVYSFTLPFGATLNMDGTAIYQGVCAMFIAFAINMPLDFTQQMTIIITAVLGSIGTAGVPGAGAILLLLVLNSVGLKVEAGSAVAMAYAMIFGIDALLDMGRTATNVIGDLAGTTVVAKLENEIDMSCWDGSEEAKVNPELAKS
jgi:Na+/H+-dicarboxylate symporter